MFATLKELTIGGKGDYGIAASACAFNLDFPQYIRITDITDDGRYKPEPRVSVNSTDYPNFTDYYLHDGDIVFARTGASTGRNYFYNPQDGKLVYAGFLIKFSLNRAKINPKYVKYYCQTKQYYDWVAGGSTGSTRNNLNAQDYASLQIPLKSETEQRHIVDILGSLDDKVENNEGIIEKLLNYSHKYYVEFIASRTFIKRKLGELVRINRGSSPRPIQDFLSLKGMPWVKISDATKTKNCFLFETEEFIKEDGIKNSVIVYPDELILSNSATPGLPKFIQIEACVHDGWLTFRDFSEITPEYLYWTLINDRELILSSGNGSIFTNLKTDILKNHIINVPTDHDLNEITSRFRIINGHILHLSIINRKLYEYKRLCLKQFFG